jgi:hypothetical protein
MASLPDSAYCGDTLEFDLTFASGTTGQVVFRHADTGHLFRVDPSISGTAWTVTVAPGKTLEAPEGIYLVAAITNLDGERATVDCGTVTLKAPIDRPARESHARKMVKLLEAHIEGRLHDEEGRGLESYTIGGVPITKIAISEARKLLAEYRRDVQNEKTQERAAAGLGTGRRVLPRFE